VNVSTTRRGYGWTHQRLRQQWTPRVMAGECVCAKCGQPIHPGQQWDLGHTDHRDGYTGPEHASCNRSDGARRGNRMRSQRQVRQRDW
jgi:hypothetical protein